MATRSVLGFHVGLEAPSSLSVALCLEHAVLPKKPPGNASDQQVSWDMFGLPLNIHVDNGPEFHGEALRRGCAEYGITLLHRPVARPRFGAHIERLIGTMMGKVHLLPGSTDASPAGRGGYDAEKEAALTLRSCASGSTGKSLESTTTASTGYWARRRQRHGPQVLQEASTLRCLPTRSGLSLAFCR